MSKSTPSDEAVAQVVADCLDQTDKGGSRFFGMSYEDGVIAALDWVKGNTDDHPYPAE